MELILLAHSAEAISNQCDLSLHRKKKINKNINNYGRSHVMTTCVFHRLHKHKLQSVKQYNLFSRRQQFNRYSHCLF